MVKHSTDFRPIRVIIVNGVGTVRLLATDLDQTLLRVVIFIKIQLWVSKLVACVDVLPQMAIFEDIVTKRPRIILLVRPWHTQVFTSVQVQGHTIKSSSKSSITIFLFFNLVVILLNPWGKLYIYDVITILLLFI